MCWLFYNVWSDRRYKQFMVLQSYLETSSIKKRTASLAFTVHKKLSSWTWSSKQAWNVILFKGELETFHRWNPREKWPLSSQKSLAANCWHLCSRWCSEIPDIWGRVKQGKLINQTSWLCFSARFLHIKSSEQKASEWQVVLKRTRLALMLLQPHCSRVLELVNASRFSLLCHVRKCSLTDLISHSCSVRFAQPQNILFEQPRISGPKSNFQSLDPDPNVTAQFLSAHDFPTSTQTATGKSSILPSFSTFCYKVFIFLPLFLW